MARRRILYVLNAFETDAPTTVMVSLGIGMRDAGFEVMFTAWSRGGETHRKTLADLGIATLVLGAGMFANALKLSRIIRDFNPHIVHASLARPTIGLALANLFLPRDRVLKVSSDHGVHEWHEKGAFQGAIMELLMPGILSRMDAVVAVSENAARELCGRGLDRGHISVIPNGVDARSFYPRATAERVRLIAEWFPTIPPEQTLLIGSSGNLRTVKGYDVLIDAIPEILAEDANARFVIWGHGPELKALLNHAAVLGLGDKIRFCGYDNEMEKRLPLLDIYVQPSRMESFGIAAAEAMACGIPVVASNVGGLSNLIDPARSGRLFQSENPKSLAATILPLLRRKSLRRRLGAAGRLRVLQHFPRQKMIDKVGHLYDRLLNNESIHD